MTDRLGRRRYLVAITHFGRHGPTRPIPDTLAVHLTLTERSSILWQEAVNKMAASPCQ